MITLGIDGLSKRVCNDGFMRGIPMLSCGPLHLSAVARSLKLIPWIRSWWTGDKDLDHYSPNNWYSKVFSKGNFI